MVTEKSRRRVLRTGGAIGAAVFAISTTAQADVSGALCNTDAGNSSFTTAVIVWVDGERTEVKIGERGLTDAIAYSEQDLLDWMRREFAGGSPDQNVGFNDCAGSQLQPQRSPVDTETGNSDSAPVQPPTVTPENPPEPHPTGNDSPVGAIDDSLIVGDGTDVLFG